MSWTWRRWLPPQHGAWCLLGVATALGLAAAGGWSWLGGTCVSVVALGFVATHLIASGSHRSVPAAARWSGATLLVGGASALAWAAPWTLVPLIVTAGTGWASATALVRGGPAAPQAVVAGGLATGAAAAAVAAAGGAEAGVIAWVATLMGIYALGRMSAVLVLLTRWDDPQPALVAALVPLAVVIALAAARGAGWWGAAAFLPATALGLWLAAAECRPSSRACGLAEFTGAVAFLLLGAVDVAP